MRFKRKPVVAGNWKMNGAKETGINLARDIARRAQDVDCEVIICPPFPLLHTVNELLTKESSAPPIRLGAQDCHFQSEGAHTGDVSATMLVDAGCRHVIIGHSERRADHHETDDLVKAKAKAAYREGLNVIICLGETQKQRDQGLTLEVISTQLNASLPEAATAQNTIIAYEPVWAIGTGLTATPEDAQEVHAHIRAHMQTRFSGELARNLRILYGGSMKPENAADLLAESDIDGGLIGGAALNATTFLQIIRAAATT